jgi:endonuclease-3
MTAPATQVDRNKVRTVYERLVDTYGALALVPGGDPLDELIGTILSQSTTDTNSGRAYERLRAIYPTWEEVLDASEREIYE